eukprot:112624_1
MSADKTEKQNLLSKSPTKGGQTYYDTEANEHINTSNNINSILEEASSIDGVKIIIAILFIVFECIPIIMGGYILNNHYSLFFVAVFALSLFAIICIAKQKFHYVLIIVFFYSMYIFMLFAIASDAFKESNAELYHIQKLKTVSVCWIVLQFIIAGIIYTKCCKQTQYVSEYDDDNQ